MNTTAPTSTIQTSAVDREDRVRVGTSLRELFMHLWPHLMRQKALFFATILTVFIVAAAGRLSITVFGLAIDKGILKQNRNLILTAAFGYFLLEGGRCLMTFFQSYWFSKLGNRVLYELRDELVTHVQSLPLTYFDRHPSGRIVTRITNDVVALGELFTQGLINVFAAVVSLAAIVFAMAMISVPMTLATLAIAPPLVWLVIKLSRRVFTAQRESKGKLAAINAYVAENIGGMKILQIYGRIPRNLNRFRELSDDYKTQQLKTVNLYAMLWPTTSFFNAASVATALYFGGRLTLNGSVTTGAMVAFILHVRAFIDPLQTILEKYQVFQGSLAGGERIFTLLDEVPENVAGSKPAARLSGRIEFKNLAFRYPSPSDQNASAATSADAANAPDRANGANLLSYALDHFSLKIEPGESIALVGRTGSGKSTTISLLQRLYDHTSGELLIDGKPIQEFARRELRRKVGVVQQDTFMFRGTIADNIGLNDPEITRAQIEAAARGACLDEFLARRGGLDTRVEERGANLSFGERQLIAFARILAFDPDILILDEATANIDSRTELLIQKATERARQGRTSLIVAHRISTIIDCDRIVVLANGRIEEVGSHDELYEKKGLYYALCEAQFKQA